MNENKHHKEFLVLIVTMYLLADLLYIHTYKYHHVDESVDFESLSERDIIRNLNTKHNDIFNVKSLNAKRKSWFVLLFWKILCLSLLGIILVFNHPEYEELAMTPDLFSYRLLSSTEL